MSLPTAPAVTAHTLTWVDLDARPYSIHYTGGDDETGPYGQDLVVETEVHEALDATGRAALDTLLDNPDSATCAAEGCEKPIGDVLWETDDGRGGLDWRWTTVVTLPDRVILVCEECSPGNLYAG